MLRWYGVHYNRNGTARAIKKWIYTYVHKRNLSEESSMWECIYEFLDEIHEHTHAPSQTEC